MRHFSRRVLTRAAAAATAVASISAFAVSASSSAAEASTTPNAIQIYCNVGYGLTDANVPDGSPVQYYTDGYSGSEYTNNWKCDYLAVYSVPMIDEDTAAGEMNLGLQYTMPPIHESVGIDFRKLCSLIYPGSALIWVPGPETGLDGSPWSCKY
jgi:hypothetical protein